MVVALVALYPLLYALYTSLFHTQFLQRTGFAGLQNYRDILLTSAGRSAILRSLLFMAGSLAVSVPLGLLLALLLNQRYPGRGVFRVLLLVPWVVSELITALLWKWIASPQVGPVPELLQHLLGKKVDLLGPGTSMLMLILANVWRTYALPTVLFLAALQGIPAELIEQSEIDGASGLRRLFAVILPLIRSTMLVAVLMLSIYYMNVVTLPLILTGGGPVGATEVLPLQLFNEAFSFFRLGKSSAISILLLMFNLLLSLLYFRLFKPYEEVR